MAHRWAPEQCWSWMVPNTPGGWHWPGFLSPAALWPVEPPVSKQISQEIFPEAGKINNVGAAGCCPLPGWGGQGGDRVKPLSWGHAAATPTALPLCHPSWAWPWDHQPWGHWKMSPCAGQGWVICHPHPGHCGGLDPAVTAGCDMGLLPGVWVWLAGVGILQGGTPSPRATL